MGFLIAILTLGLLALIVLVVSGPLRDAAERRQTETGEGFSSPAPGSAAVGQGQSDAVSRDELEAAREAKYREIRDAEMDFRTGKLSDQDYRRLDAELRAEALAILDGLTALEDAEEPAGER